MEDMINPFKKLYQKIDTALVNWLIYEPPLPPDESCLMISTVSNMKYVLVM